MKYVTCDIMGGIGNQLFQIFTVIAYAIKQIASMEKNPEQRGIKRLWNKLDCAYSLKNFGVSTLL